VSSADVHENVQEGNEINCRIFPRRFCTQKTAAVIWALAISSSPKIQTPRRRRRLGQKRSNFLRNIYNSNFDVHLI